MPQGLDVWLSFDKDVILDPQVRSNLQSAFNFTLMGSPTPEKKLISTEFLDELEYNQRLKYFLPLNLTILNETLTVKTDSDQKIYSKLAASNMRRMLTRMLLVSKLNLPQDHNIIERYGYMKNDDQISVGQLYWFFRIFQWFALIVMIICAFFGIGVIFEDFSIMLQVLFLHIYISSKLLPATFKAPFEGL